MRYTGESEHSTDVHALQLFDDDDSLAATLASFLREGFAQKETLLVVATTDHWHATHRLLASTRMPVEAAAQSGQLTVLGADHRTLSLILGPVGLDPRRFHSTIGVLVRQLAARGAPLRVYGELVDALAARGELDAALELEELWNDLIATVPLRLLCGYAAAHFGDAQGAAKLHRICRTHSRLRSNPRDVLGSFLLRNYVLQPGLSL